MNSVLKKKKKRKKPLYKRIGILAIEVLVLGVVAALFILPFYFVIINALKTKGEASLMNMSFPSELMFIENIKEVVAANNGIIFTAFKNSFVITLISTILILMVCSLLAFYIQRRSGKLSSVVSLIILSGLMIPPAIVPTIWVLQGIKLYKTIWGLIFVEVALQIPFSTMLYRGFIGSIPREIDEASIIDGCGIVRMFFNVIFPLLKPVTATVIILSAISVFNDYVNPLYFLPGSKNATVQLTLYNFTGRYSSSWNLLFMDILVISIPMLILFIVFNKQIVAGMTSGSVKG